MTVDFSSLSAIRTHQPALPAPRGVSRDQLLQSLISLAIDGSRSGELESYAREDCDRFLYTLDLVPEDAQQILEVGSNPYFLTYLMKIFRKKAHIKLLNYFGGPPGTGRQTIRSRNLTDEHDQEFAFDYMNINIEAHDIPLASGACDVVLFCEVIEHLLEDPLRALLELKRVLRPGGQLVLTTPNVARLENLARIASGANIYDPYSGYGPYGRHNREYTRHELYKIMTYCGFSPEILFTADVHPNRAADYFDLSRLDALVDFRAPDLGQYLFSRWRNTGPAPTRKPSWLYRSYPTNLMEEVLL
ncbi:MAG: class I SAM-dependent methyltransferase [Caulobacteraceae bacterium]